MSIINRLGYEWYILMMTIEDIRVHRFYAGKKFFVQDSEKPRKYH